MHWRSLVFAFQPPRLLPRILDPSSGRTVSFRQRPGSIVALCSASSHDSHHTNDTCNGNQNNNKIITLRNATLDDLDLLQYWDEKPHLQDPNVSGLHEEELNDWNWAYELPRTDVSWRYQLIAELVVPPVTLSRNDDSTNSVVKNCNTDTTKVPIGFLQIIDPVHEESHYWQSYLDLYPLEKSPVSVASALRAIDIWIGEEENLGQGYGSHMMKAALEEYCFADDMVQAVLVDPMAANFDAHRFYKRCGFQPEARHSFGPDHCLVHRLTKTQYYTALPLSSVSTTCSGGDPAN